MHDHSNTPTLQHSLTHSLAHLAEELQHHEELVEVLMTGHLQGEARTGFIHTHTRSIVRLSE